MYKPNNDSTNTRSQLATATTQFIERFYIGSHNKCRSLMKSDSCLRRRKDRLRTTVLHWAPQKLRHYNEWHLCRLLHYKDCKITQTNSWPLYSPQVCYYATTSETYKHSNKTATRRIEAFGTTTANNGPYATYTTDLKPVRTTGLILI